jgi:hypothetical protein
MKDLLNTIETIWCETMHDRVMWPIHGRYLCSTCLREYPVAFDDTETQRHRETLKPLRPSVLSSMDRVSERVV